MALVRLGCGESDSQEGWTALIEAATEGHVECVRLLIEAGTNKEAKDHVRIGYCFSWKTSRVSLIDVSPSLHFLHTSSF